MKRYGAIIISESQVTDKAGKVMNLSAGNGYANTKYLGGVVHKLSLSIYIHALTFLIHFEHKMRSSRSPETCIFSF